LSGHAVAVRLPESRDGAWGARRLRLIQSLAGAGTKPMVCCDLQESQDSKDGDAEGETDPKPGPAAAARAAAATAKAAAQQREAPPPKAKAGDPAAGGTLTEKEGRSTGAPRARAPPPLTALEGPRQVPGAWRRAHAGSFSPVHLGSSFPAAQAAAGHGTRPNFALRK